MLLSKAQSSWFWREWAKACSVQGWQGDEKEQRRREVLLEVGFDSLTKVDKTAGFDRLKARVMALQYRLEGATNEVFPANGDMRRHLHLIRTRHIPALARLVPDPAAYVAEVCRDKFGHRGPWYRLGDHPETGPRRVQELLFTLAARVSSLRRAADAGKSDISLVNPPSEAPIGHFAPSPDSTAPF
jgi:hypothetical protein